MEISDSDVQATKGVTYQLFFILALKPKLCLQQPLLPLAQPKELNPLLRSPLRMQEQDEEQQLHFEENGEHILVAKGGGHEKRGSGMEGLTGTGRGVQASSPE